MAKLRLQIDWISGTEDANWDEGGAFNLSLIRSLRGLRKLRLCIGHHVPLNIFRVNADIQTSYTDSIARLAILPLTMVEVVVNDSSDARPWTEVNRKRFAGSIRARLLDPEGARRYWQDRLELKEMGRQIRQQERDAISVRRRNWQQEKAAVSMTS